MLSTNDSPQAAQILPLMLDTKGAAAFLGLEPKTLENDRNDGRFGVPFVRYSKGAVRYRRADLEDFIQARLVRPAATA